MKNKLWSIVILLCPLLVFAEVDIALEQECRGDIELVDYVVNLIETDGKTDSEFFSAEEKAQILTVLNSEQVVGGRVRDKVETVLVACSSAEILQERNTQGLSSN